MRALLPLVAACALAGSGSAACGNSVQADTGTDAYMQVGGAQFVRGPMPQGSSAGPSVVQLALIGNDIWPGMQNDPIGGALGATATAAAIGLERDTGYWIVPAGVPDVNTPRDPSFGGSASFSEGIVPGTYTLVVRGVDGAGNFGPPKTQILSEVHSPTNPPPVGQLVVTLTWDTESNLDLHVVDPGGTDIYWGNQSDQPPFSFDQVDGGSYGYIDDDSNANCVIDGLRREDAIWPNAPPPGTYTVRVDAAALCGQAIANWTVKVMLHGKLVAQAGGVAVDASTRGNHGTNSGVTALQFTVPR